MAQTSYLDKLVKLLRRRRPRRERRCYRVPPLWNDWGFSEFDTAGRGQIAIDPHRFALSCIEAVILAARGDRRLAGRSLSRSRGVRCDRGRGRYVRDEDGRRRGGDWIRQASLYSLLVRTTTAWDHDGDGRLAASRWTETGTFLKTILLLPLLRRMGITVLYLLPVTRCSRRFKKGELGCPYAAQGFTQLEPDLHDRLLGPDATLVDLEFAALVEAAHAMGMRVMVDVAPRTTARDSDLLLDHPDWFYWIEKRHERRFGAPPVASCDASMPKPSQLGSILREPAAQRHLAAFRWAPNVSDPKRWQQLAKKCRREGTNVLAAIEREFKLTTAPGFSDCLNDPQPPWSDVTFLRLFLDHPTASARHLHDPASQPPYAFTDSIKASLFPGRRPNRPLWKRLAGVLPWYQQFGVDGARVDMGHALPRELQEMIVRAPRRSDPDFCFLAEEFNHARAASARHSGYNAIIGSGWYMEPRASEGELHRFVQETLPGTALPALACADLPDCPRSVTRPGGRAFARLAAVLNQFLPNGIPMLTTGGEVFERQPMNEGLDTPEGARFVLPKSDPFYGKLAYFDRFVLHWTNAGAAALIDLMAEAARVRHTYLHALSDPKAVFFPQVTANARHILALGWRFRDGSTLLLVANTDHQRRRRAIIDDLPLEHRATHTLLSHNPDSGGATVKSGCLALTLEPGGARVIAL